LELAAYKAWVKATDVNGLQTEIMKQPFNQLADKMTGYIQTMYGRDDIKAYFYVSSKANSFSFGMIRDNKYMSYDLLSSGEKCLYTLALMICIIDNSKSPLKVVLLDDALDNLDDVAIENTFTALKNITNIQFILAGVKHSANASDVIVNVV
jgi:DNA repair exonuclease SbcCD ATPase subunit